MNLEKNVQEFEGFLAGKYDHCLVTRGDEYAGWNYFTETYFDCLECPVRTTDSSFFNYD
ncbi:hypothetical protein [Pasteurella atlantica]|uniref:hypothetical protein n=1 Tax=Pasteurellaceae TaxID=712 RepID=UPI00276F067A|nr:hypothetical protein [Pasteurella atlantica]MDP8099883.1 hypothetical protein [Pasteurella atlantica]MDP8107729.1 hypothetical protein [Pasteurella atlantica]MDP8117502.1 hypothetical protein [Pasteurella atlantica]